MEDLEFLIERKILDFALDAEEVAGLRVLVEERNRFQREEEEKRRQEYEAERQRQTWRTR